MSAVVSGQDSLVVLPTGGGKSLCFQAPAVILPGMAVIVSPLISLMKDQVDGLVESGVSAARLDSSLTAAEQNDALQKIRCGALKLLYVAPERLVSDSFIVLLKRMRPSFIAIDEAHCISMWGHDFRPEYRQLGQLRELFPKMALHAYTATATEKVRADVALQLRLADPKILVGSFDRPNLVYRVERRENRLGQVCAILDRHKGESGLVYCIRRADVDELCASLVAKGYRALPYHAGMEDEARKANQDAFIRERADIIVATVAFGMGIDKSNVRFVIHAGHAEVARTLSAGKRPRRPRRTSRRMRPALLRRRLRRLAEHPGKRRAGRADDLARKTQPHVLVLHRQRLPPEGDSRLLRPGAGEAQLRRVRRVPRRREGDEGLARDRAENPLQRSPAGRAVRRRLHRAGPHRLDRRADPAKRPRSTLDVRAAARFLQERSSATGSSNWPRRDAWTAWASSRCSR